MLKYFLQMGDLLNIKDVKLLCIVCLTKSRQILGLNDFIEEEERSLQIKNVLEEVMSAKIPALNNTNYPSCICFMCLRLLKISYDLKQQFERSSQLMRDYFKEDFEPLIVQSCNSEQSLQDTHTTSVEIIFGSNKYNLNDILIVEDVNENQSDYKHFLDNLGKSITASFVKKINKSNSANNYNIEPHVSIEKIPKCDRGTSKKFKSETLLNEKKLSHEVSKVTSMLVDDIDQYILLDGEPVTVYESEEPIHIEKGKYVPLLEIEKYIITNDASNEGNFNDSKINITDYMNVVSCDDLIQSASNMQYKCKDCQRIYSLKGRYLNHIKTCKKSISKEQTDFTQIPQLSCPMCSRKFKQKKFLNFHVKTVHKTPFYKCEICNMILNNRNRYLYHKLTKHSERKYICDICGKKFLTSSSLKTHSLHHNKRIAQCVCPICGKTFHYKSGLFYHMKMHTNERKYFCNYCDRKFYTLTAKKRHTLTHTGDRPYPCKFCDKRFFSMGEVRKHEYIHTGERPMHCDYCDKGFTSKFNLKVHLFSHAGSYKCTYCERGFITEDILQFHYKMKHRGLEVP